MAVPTFLGAGAIATDVSGGASTTPSPPSHLADDILIAVAFNQAASAMSTATSGWSQLQGSAGNRFNSWWKRATGSGTAGPTITAASTDQFAVCYGFRGCKITGDPFEVKNGVNETTSTTPTVVSGGSSLGVDRLAVAFVANDDDTVYSSGLPPTNWDLASDLSTATGTQARFTVITRNMPSAADAGSPVVGTLATSEIWWLVSLYLIPIPVVPPIGKINQMNQAIKRGSYF